MWSSAWVQCELNLNGIESEGKPFFHRFQSLPFTISLFFSFLGFLLLYYYLKKKKKKLEKNPSIVEYLSCSSYIALGSSWNNHFQTPKKKKN